MNHYSLPDIFRKITLLLIILLINTSLTALSRDIVVNGNSETKIIVLENTYNRLILSNNLATIRTIKIHTDQGVFTELIIPGYSATDIIGSPKLPVNRQLIEIPVGATPVVIIKSTKTKIIDLDDLGIRSKIFPAQPPVPKDGTQVDFVFDHAAYNKNTFYYAEPVSVDVLGYMRGLRIGRVNISPVQYNPVTNTIRVFEEIEFEVLFEGANVDLTLSEKQKNNAPYFVSLGRYFLNYKPENTVNRDTITIYPVKYVIVSDPMFAAQLQPFVEWKTKKGFTVIEAYTDDPAVGNTTSSIKTYLEGLYQAGTPDDPAPSFVLFVGDVNQVPAWNGSAGGHVTDLPYCEYTNDYFPEVYYGRFSAQDSSQLQPQIDKTLQYEQYLMPDPSFLNEVVMVAGMDASHGHDWGNGQINYGTENYFNTAHGILSHTYLYPESGSHSADIIQNVSDGVAFGNYTAHCSSSGWGNPSFTTSNVPSLQNQDKYGLLVGNCCSSNDYSSDECFGEALLRAENKGALGYIGGSNSTFWDEDYYWGVGVGPITENPPSYEETTLGSYDRTFHDHMEPFEDWYTTQDQMVYAGNLAVTQGCPGSAQYYWEIYCVMGDPSLMVYFSEPPVLSVSYDPLMPLGATSFTVTTEPYAYVAISKDGVLHGAALADAGGIAVVPLYPINIPGEADVVVTKQNAQPYIGTVIVNSPQGPYIMLSDYEVVDSIGGNGNGQVDYSETISLNVELENIGNSDAVDVSAVLSSTDEFITITDDYEEWGDIPTQTAAMQNDAYTFEVADSIPDQHEVIFDLAIQDSTRSNWNSSFSLVLNAPVLAFGGYTIDDSQSGNGNGKLDPGETVDMIVEVMNTGHSDALNAAGYLASSSTDITINNSSFNLDTIPYGNSQNAIFNITVSEDVPTGTSVSFSFEAEAGSYNITEDFFETVGQIPILVLDLDGNNNSANEMMTCLSNLEVGADYSADFPEDLDLYASVFVCLGVYPENHKLTSDEGQKLADYLNNGEMLYMEGGDTWYYDDQTAVHEMFNIDGLEDGNSDLSDVIGQSGTMTDSMEYHYSGDNNYMDHIAPVTPAEMIFMNTAPSYGCGVSYDAGSYKTIGMSFEFGGLDDDEFTKEDLMITILDFFGIEGIWTNINDPYISEDIDMNAYPNPMKNSTRLLIKISAQDNVSVKLYNSVGQLVSNIVDQQIIPEGIFTHDLDTSGLEAGIYYCILTTGDHLVTRKLIIIR
ncbi:MAG: T9SS type A sorting domain-containing protein [Bacteroidetes bacterium]|nr:T9SS type A sorting domain-containing protein [Bacteroidota bacterium]